VRTTYTCQCLLRKKAQLSSLALSPPGQALLDTVPSNPTQEFSITSRSSYAGRLVAVTGTVRLHARTEGGLQCMAPTCTAVSWLLGAKVHRTSDQVGQPAGRRTLATGIWYGRCHTICLITTCGEFNHLCADATCQLGIFLIVSAHVFRAARISGCQQAAYWASQHWASHQTCNICQVRQGVPTSCAPGSHLPGTRFMPACRPRKHICCKGGCLHGQFAHTVESNA
jgi:hypothetical protein